MEVNASDTRNKADASALKGVGAKLANSIKELSTNSAIGLGADDKPKRVTPTLLYPALLAPVFTPPYPTLLYPVLPAPVSIPTYPTLLYPVLPLAVTTPPYPTPPCPILHHPPYSASSCASPIFPCPALPCPSSHGSCRLTD